MKRQEKNENSRDLDGEQAASFGGSSAYRLYQTSISFICLGGGDEHTVIDLGSGSENMSCSTVGFFWMAKA